MGENKDAEMHEVVSQAFKKVMYQSIVSGHRAACSVILERIRKFTDTAYERTVQDYSEFLDSIAKFCETGLDKSTQQEG